MLIVCSVEGALEGMESGQEARGEGAVARAKRAAEIARLAQKKAEKKVKEALADVRRELKRKDKVVELRKGEARKKTVKAYFESSRGSGAGQPLSMVLDGKMPDVPGAEPTLEREYPSDYDEEGRLIQQTQSTSLSADIAITPDSSSGSSDTVVLSAKSPLITISEDSEEPDISQFVEVPVDFEDSDDDDDFESPSSKIGGSSRSKWGSSHSLAQTRYDRHRKFQTVWAAKLPWAEGIMATDGILHMVQCKVCSTIDRKPCVMAPKSDTLFKHDGKRTAKKDLP